MKENISAADKLRSIVRWLDYQDETFNDKMKTIDQIERVYDACDKVGLEFADNLNWEDETDPEYELARMVNEIIGRPYYLLRQPDDICDIPEWALNYLVNGTRDTLDDEDVDIIEAWQKENFPSGCVVEVDWEDYNTINFFPAFGHRNENAMTDRGESPYLGVTTYKCLIYKA